MKLEFSLTMPKAEQLILKTFGANITTFQFSLETGITDITAVMALGKHIASFNERHPKGITLAQYHIALGTLMGCIEGSCEATDMFNTKFVKVLLAENKDLRDLLSGVDAKITYAIGDKVICLQIQDLLVIIDKGIQAIVSMSEGELTQEACILELNLVGRMLSTHMSACKNF